MLAELAVERSSAYQDDKTDDKSDHVRIPPYNKAKKQTSKTLHPIIYQSGKTM